MRVYLYLTVFWLALAVVFVWLMGRAIDQQLGGM